ncbi:SAM-dependent methyltransferase [Tissierella creatinini]|nr:SAM-dependent methyltransferase [Tissierella creatinini]TJX67154.1 SAM-dependent methyltransferase [Soehngenia saccharolytica]
MRLSKRLQKIADFVPNNSITADIGTDHGYIPRYLVEYKISKLVIASDVSQGSLDKTISYIDELGLNNKIIPRLGDGLEVLKPYEVDTVVIAGMGGLLIRDILEKNKGITNSITHFVLQPMVASKELRKYLLNNGFMILDEELVFEDEKFYEIIYAKKGKDLVEKDIYYEISPILIKKKHPILAQFLKAKNYSLENILSGLEGKDTEKSKEKFNELTDLVEKYKEVLNTIES